MATMVMRILQMHKSVIVGELNDNVFERVV